MRKPCYKLSGLYNPIKVAMYITKFGNAPDESYIYEVTPVYQKFYLHH